MAPEILLHDGYDGGKADVWSMGVVLFILLAGNPPFQLARRGDWWFNALLDNDWDRFWKAHRKYAPHFPVAAQAFLSSLFQPDPFLRPSSKQLLSHEWLQGPSFTPGQLKHEMMARQGDVAREKEKEREKAKQEKLRQLQEAAAASAAAAVVAPTSPMSLGSGTSTIGTGGSSGGSDNFYKEEHLTRHRSVCGGVEEEGVVSSPKESEKKQRKQKLAPLLPAEGGLKGFTYFYSNSSSSEELLDRLHFLLLVQLSATIKPPQGTREEEEEAIFHLRCLVPLTAAKVRLDIRLWRVEEEKEGQEEEEEGEGKKLVLHVIEVTRKEGDPVLFHRVYQTIKTKMEEEERQSLLNGSTGGDGRYGSPALPFLLPSTPSEHKKFLDSALPPVPQEQGESEPMEENEGESKEGGEERGEEEDEEGYPRPECLHEEQMSNLTEML
jgi:hypothetical protein